MAMHRAAPPHSIFVHFTIALVDASLLFDVVGRVYHLQSLLAAAWWTIVTAVPLTIVTATTGVMARRRVAIAEGPALKHLRLHVAIGPTFFGCLVAMAIWRTTYWRQAISPSGWYLLALVAVAALMGIQGFIGGELVYRFGLGVQGNYTPLPIHRNDTRVG